MFGRWHQYWYWRKIIQGKSIGEDSVIGAGAVVIKSIEPNSTAVGVPAKVIKGNR